MNSKILSPSQVSNHVSTPRRSSRKRRARDRSPDMFANDDDSSEDSTELSQTDSALGTSMTSGSSLRLSQEIKTESTTPIIPTQLIHTSSTSKTTTPPEHKFAMPTKLPISQDYGSVGNLSGSSPKAFSDSLMSTAASSNHFGLNARVQAALNSKNSTPAKLYRFSSDSSPASGVTPPVYTLNNSSTISTQRPVFSGPHYGLSAEVWKVVQECKGVETLYQWQEECLKKALESTLNLIYSLPTSGGKTLVAELLMVREILCNKKNCLYVLPYVSIVQEKIRTLSSLAVALDFSLEEYAGNRGSFPPRKRNSKNVMFIATLEKANGIANSLMQEGRLQEIGLVVVDEVHIIGEGKRGATLETLLCKLLLAPVGPRIVAMSATIGNITELKNFLKAEIFTGDFRPVELREYIKSGDTVFEIGSGTERCRESLLKISRSLHPPSAAKRKIDPDGLALLVGEVAPKHCCLVFCSTKKSCENVAKLISSNLPSNFLEEKQIEKHQLMNALKAESGELCPVLRNTLPHGVAYHHSGLTADERQLIEEAFSAGILCCLCCTSTLAAGVNLPARRVILRSPYIGQMKLTRARYQQMVGRAGRAGFDTHGESIMIVQPGEMPFVTNDILLAPTDRVESQLIEDNLRGLQQLILSLLSLDLGGKDRIQLAETLMHSTLLGQQSTQLKTSAIEFVDRSIQGMSAKSLLSIGTEGQLEVTKLGRATLKGTVDLDRSGQLYQDLRQAQTALCVHTKLHLLYLVTPYDLFENVHIIARTYFDAYTKLNKDEQAVAQILSINELCMSQLMRGRESKVDKTVLKRFYLTLMLNDIVKGESYWNVSERYGFTRGDVQNLLAGAASFASCVYHFVSELDEFWAFSELLLPFSRELSLCCSSELVPLMELPSVAKGRARLLHKAGYRTLADVAKTNADELVSRVQHLPKRTALQMIAAAKVLVYEKMDIMREELDLFQQILGPKPSSRLANLMDETFQTQASNVSMLDDSQFN